MNNEKIVLTGTLSLIFLLSSVLFYVMITKDLKLEKKNESRGYHPERVDERSENIWPKVEIDVRK